MDYSFQMSFSDCMAVEGHFRLPKRPVAPDAVTETVLRERTINPTEPLPTICASYGHQHELATHHLLQRGMFTFFSSGSEGFCWVEPPRIVALLGGQTRVSIERQPTDAYHVLGNAIAVPQAALAILVGLQAIQAETIPILRIVHDIWLKRMTTHNAFLCKLKVTSSPFHRLSWHSNAFQFAARALTPLP